jgi:hypothetical protein
MFYILNCLDLETNQIKTLGCFDNYQSALNYLLNSSYLEYKGNLVNIQSVKNTIPNYQDPDGYYLVQDQEHPKNYYLWKKMVSYGYIWNSYAPSKLTSYQISTCQDVSKNTSNANNTNHTSIGNKHKSKPEMFSLNDLLIDELKKKFIDKK